MADATELYRDSELLLSAGFKLENPRGQALLIALGDAFDQAVWEMKEGVKARYPTRTSPSLRAIIGEERQMLKGAGESEESYGRRLVAAWETWRWAGTPFGLLTALRAAGYGNARLLIHNRRQFQLNDAGALVVTKLHPEGFTPRVQRGFWSEFELVLDRPHPSAWYTHVSNLPKDMVSRTNTTICTLSGAPTRPFDFAIKSVTTGYPYPFNGGDYVVSLDGGATWTAQALPILDRMVPTSLDAHPGLAETFPGMTPTGLTLTFSYAASFQFVGTVLHMQVGDNLPSPTRQLGSGGLTMMVMEGLPVEPSTQVTVSTTNPTAGMRREPGDPQLEIAFTVSQGGRSWTSEPYLFVRDRIRLDELSPITGEWFPTGLSFWGDGFFLSENFTFTTPAVVPGPVFSPPGPESPEAKLVRYLVNLWKPAHATMSRITLRDRGDLWGYPNQTWGQASAAGKVWGGVNEVHWHA